MTNLKSARQAIKAELDHARKGAEYYQSRVAALEEALDRIDSVETGNGKISNSSRAASPRGQAKPGRKARTQPEDNGSDGAKLPSTGKDFWPNLITTEPQSAKEILEAAVKTLRISPTKELVKKLSQRQTTALNTLVKNKGIADSGAGRERRFFRKH